MTHAGRWAGPFAALICAAIGVGGVAGGLDLVRADPLVGLVPLGSSILLVLFAVLSLRPSAGTEPAHERLETPARPWAAPAVAVALVAYLAAMDAAGFMLDTGLLILATLGIAGVRRPIAAGVTVLALLGIAALFQYGLGVDLPRGRLADWLS